MPRDSAIIDEINKRDREHRDAVVAYLGHGLLRMPPAQRAILEQRDRELAEVRSMGTQTGPDGGFLMPESWVAEVRMRMAESWLWEAATVVDATQKYHGFVLGLPTVQGVAQAGDGSVTATESTPSVSPFLLNVGTYGPLDLRHMPALVRVSRRLFEDAGTERSLDAALPRAFARAASKVLHTQWITGTHSATTIMGLKGSIAIDSTRAVTSIGSSSVALADLRNLIDKMGSEELDGCEFVFHPKALPDDLARSSKLFTLPVRISSALDAPASGNKKSAVLWRPRAYVIATNFDAMRVVRLDEKDAPSGLVGFQLNLRMDACIDETTAFAMLNHV